MQRDEVTWRQAIEGEEAASTAVVQAERALQQVLQHHLASSPEVDAAVTELDLRRVEYARTLRATDAANNLFHRTQWDAIVADRDRRRADHEQRIQTVLQQVRAGRPQASATRSPVATHSSSSSSDDDPSPRPTKRLNLGRPPSTGSIQHAGSGDELIGGGDSGDSSSSGSAGDSPPAPVNRLMPMHLFVPQVHGRPPALAPTQAHAAGYRSDSETESKSHHADSNAEESESVEPSEFVPSTESEDSSN